MASKNISQKRKIAWIVLIVFVVLVYIVLFTNHVHNALMPLRNDDYLEPYKKNDLYYSANPIVDFIEVHKLPTEDIYRRNIVMKRKNVLLSVFQKNVSWEAFNYVDANNPEITFSINIPNTSALELDGWIFGWDLYTSGQWIRSSTTNKDGENATTWEIMVGVVQDGKDINAADESETIKVLQGLKVGETQTLPMFSHETVTFTVTREKDFAVNGETFQVFSTTDNQFSEIAFLDNGDYVVAFFYGHHSQTFNVFKDILSSYIPELREDATVGELSPIKTLDEIVGQKIFN